VAQHILVFGVRLYRWVISPAKIFVFGPLGQCRFTPSCSVYALEAVTQHGALKGSWLGLRRMCRCHPWGGCGDDPVPPVSRSAWQHRSGAAQGLTHGARFGRDGIAEVSELSRSPGVYHSSH
jgi:hypothetical protein